MFIYAVVQLDDTPWNHSAFGVSPNAQAGFLSKNSKEKEALTTFQFILDPDIYNAWEDRIPNIESKKEYVKREILKVKGNVDIIVENPTVENDLEFGLVLPSKRAEALNYVIEVRKELQEAINQFINAVQLNVGIEQTKAHLDAVHKKLARQDRFLDMDYIAKSAAATKVKRTEK